VKTKKTIKKPFDCVASKRKAQTRIYRKIKGMTPEQEAAYFDRATREGPFADMWAKLVAGGRKARPSGRLPRANRQSA
jgi:hypothetical protein